MKIPLAPPNLAWQPFTPRGVAAFADAPWRRLALVQAASALIAAVAIAWFLHDGWFPTITSAIRALPDRGEIHSQKLIWPGETPVQLAGDEFLTLVLDLGHESKLGREADVCVAFGQTDVWFCSLFGCWAVEYPAGWVIAFNRQELQPKWGAWEPVFLAGAILVVVPGLMLIWSALAGLYCGVAWLIAFYSNRDLSLRGAWKLSAAALLPGSLIMSASIFAYGAGVLDLLRLVVGFGLHVLVGWLYVVLGALFRPPVTTSRLMKSNPFAPPPKS